MARGRTARSGIIGRPKTIRVDKPKVPILIAKKPPSSTSRMPGRNENDFGSSYYNGPLPTPRKRPESTLSSFIASPLIPSVSHFLTMDEGIQHQPTLATPSPAASQLAILRSVGSVGITTHPPPGTSERSITSEGWIQNMRIMYCSAGYSFITLPVRYSPVCEKSYVVHSYIGLSGYQCFGPDPSRSNKAFTPWGFKGPGPLTNVVLEIDGMLQKCHQFKGIEVVTFDPDGAVLVIGSEDMAQIEARLGHTLPHNDFPGFQAPHHAQGAQYVSTNGNNSLHDTAYRERDFPLLQGQSGRSSDDWNQSQQVSQASYFLGMGSHPGNFGGHGNSSESNTFHFGQDLSATDQDLQNLFLLFP